MSIEIANIKQINRAAEGNNAEGSEDRVGVHGNDHSEDGRKFFSAWVIDGATSIDPNAEFIEDKKLSDPAWFADALSKAYERLLNSGEHASGSPAFFETALRQVCKKFNGLVDEAENRQALEESPLPAYPHATQAFVTVDYEKGTMTVTTSGDCVVVVVPEGGAELIVVDKSEAEHVAPDYKNMIGQIVEDDYGTYWVSMPAKQTDAGAENKRQVLSGDMTEAQMQVRSIEIRTRNIEKGWVLSACDQYIEQTVQHGQERSVTFKIPETGSLSVLVMSDGLSRLVDVFKQLTYAELVMQVKQNGLDATVDLLRTLEEGISADEAVRVKTRDDASAIYLEVKRAAEEPRFMHG